jgi:hypothetical protein
MLIDEKSLEHWINKFYGYGSWSAKIWFVGFEETGGDLPEEVAEKINYFAHAHSCATDATLCDIRELYRQVKFRIEGPRGELFDTFHDHRFGTNATLHGLWKNLIAFVHGYQNKKLPDLLAYQKKSFASARVESEAWIQLYPLPAHNHAWYYAWLDVPRMPFLKNRRLYEEHAFQSRVDAILKNMGLHKPKVVLMYGMNDINSLKDSVRKFFPAAKFKMVKATPRVIPQHHVTSVDGTAIVITTQIPALRHNRIETGFDWEKLGQSLNVNSI